MKNYPIKRLFKFIIYRILWNRRFAENIYVSTQYI